MGSALVGRVTPALHKVDCSGSAISFSNAFGVTPALSPFLGVARGTRRGWGNRREEEPGGAQAGCCGVGGFQRCF